ncbi:hypothetical protein HK104_007176 [Borealophlyctis nickersoniae]|nr:hypothetical protein HK104_007176 [Borealophlyctis nickersoniae]
MSGTSDAWMREAALSKIFSVGIDIFLSSILLTQQEQLYLNGRGVVDLWIRLDGNANKAPSLRSAISALGPSPLKTTTQIRINTEEKNKGYNGDDKDEDYDGDDKEDEEDDHPETRATLHEQLYSP